jgi:hypothetical protein
MSCLPYSNRETRMETIIKKKVVKDTLDNALKSETNN